MAIARRRPIARPTVHLRGKAESGDHEAPFGPQPASSGRGSSGRAGSRVGPWGASARSPSSRAVTAALALGTASLLGCSALPTRTATPEAEPPEFVLLKVAAGDGPSAVRSKVDVSTGAAYDALRGQMKTIAVLLPPGCGPAALGDTAAQCAQWAASMESAARGAGWEVGGTTVSGTVPPVQFARDVGAQGVLLFGRIDEAAPTPMAESSTTSPPQYTFWASNPWGEALETRELPKDHALALSGFADTRLTGASGAASTRLQTTVDLTMLNGQTGLPVWFYQNVAGLTAGGARRPARFLFARYKGEWFPARREVPILDGASASASDPTVSAARAAIRESVVKDIVERFRSGQGAQK